MWIELLCLITLIFLIAVLFYKQRRKDLQILQLEEGQVTEQLADLLEEGQPLVVRGVATPRGLRREELSSFQRLANYPVGGHPLTAVLANPALLATAGGLPTLSQELREEFATELSMPIWATKVWLEPLASTRWLGRYMGTLKTEAVLGGLGLFRTTAYYTILLPSEGVYHVSIVSRESEDLLPANWQYRYVSSFTPNDTPLVADIRYLDIVLRPGTALILPSHMLVCLEPREPTAFSALAIVEYHEPVSLLSKSFAP